MIAEINDGITLSIVIRKTEEKVTKFIRVKLKNLNPKPKKIKNKNKKSSTHILGRSLIALDLDLTITNFFNN